MKKSLALILFIFILIFFFSSPKIALGAILFQDNFNDNDISDWTVARNMQWSNSSQPCLYQGSPTTWKAENGRVGIKIDGPGCVTELIPNNFNITEGLGYSYNFEMEFTGSFWANRNVIFKYLNPSNWYDFMFYGPTIHFQKVVGSYYRLESISYPFQGNQTYNFRIDFSNNVIKLFIDNTQIWQLEDSPPYFSGGTVGLQASVGADPDSEVWYDNVLVTSLEPEPTPTPTPTPSPTLQPLILLPGLGESWNHQEIFLGIDQPQSAWYETPFINYYDGLIQTLQNAGYTLGENLFVFYYDWLQVIDQSAIDLRNYINTVVNPPPGTKVDLIGHSLGGLVGRAYVQNNPGSHKVDQLITAGSPHKGAPQVYKAWEGAELHDLLGEKERIGAGILLRLQGFSYPNLVQTIQNLVSSLGNLLFIDDYLKWDKTGVAKPEPSMSQQNTWLKGLGISSELLDLTSTLVGTSGDTPRWLKIIERSQVDEELGRWEDGKPVGEESAIGDRTVIEESAKLAGANIVTLASLDHGELIKDATAQEEILKLLGFTGIEIVEQPETPFEPALVFTVASPVTLRVTDPLERQIGAGIDFSEIPNATFSAQEKIIIIPQAVDGKYKVEVISENDGGLYQLLFGQLTAKQDLWTKYQGEVGPNSPDTYTLPFDSNLQTADIYLANLINLKLKNLLHQIRIQKINFRVKARLTAKVFKIFGQTKPLPILLKLERDKLTVRLVQRAIFRTTEAIDYAEEFTPDLLPPLREVLDLLGQLYQLLEG